MFFIRFRNFAFLLCPLFIFPCACAGPIIDFVKNGNFSGAAKTIIDEVELARFEWPEDFVRAAPKLVTLLDEALKPHLCDLTSDTWMRAEETAYFYGRMLEMLHEINQLKKGASDLKKSRELYDKIFDTIENFLDEWHVFLCLLADAAPVLRVDLSLMNPGSVGPYSVRKLIAKVARKYVNIEGYEEKLRQLVSFLSTCKSFAKEFGVNNPCDNFSPEVYMIFDGGFSLEFDLIADLGSIKNLCLEPHQIEQVKACVKNGEKLEDALFSIMACEPRSS
ncbi:hypothetical protein HOD08_00450 [bacterium]|nr:hypothetical protein [bacterium]